MPQNLFAACRKNDQLVARRICLNENVRNEVEDLFSDQEISFRDGVINEIPFDGSWKPEEDEFLILDIPEEAQLFTNTIKSNTISIPNIDIRNFDLENIKALFTGVSNGDTIKVLIQQFSTRQILSRKHTLFQSGNTFQRLSDTAFVLDTSLTCIVEGGKLKFKSFHKMRSILNLIDIYKEATDQEIKTFAEHKTFEVVNQSAFVDLVDQTSRKLIHAIMHSEILNDYKVVDIENAATAVGMNVHTDRGKIIMPTERGELKRLLHFLDDGLYKAPLSGQRYITNSKRRV